MDEMVSIIDGKTVLDESTRTKHMLFSYEEHAELYKHQLNAKAQALDYMYQARLVRPDLLVVPCYNTSDDVLLYIEMLMLQLGFPRKRERLLFSDYSELVSLVDLHEITLVTNYFQAFAANGRLRHYCDYPKLACYYLDLRTTVKHESPPVERHGEDVDGINQGSGREHVETDHGSKSYQQCS